MNRRPSPKRDTARLARSAAQAATTAAKGAELAVASAQVIAARLAIMGANQSGLPTGGVVREMALMVPEKTEAFAAAGVSMAGHLGSIAATGAQAAVREGAHAAEACADIAMARTPVELAAAQTRYLTGWFSRAATSAIALTALTTRLHADALEPIHKTATANARRLTK
jgi:hypothetical protein